MSKGRNTLGVFLSVICFLLLACNNTSDEEKIKSIINQMSRAVEEKTTVDIATHFHSDFRANGDMNAQQVKQLLMLVGMQHQAISITIVSAKTIVDPVYSDRAESVLSVVMTGSSGGLLPNDGAVRVVKLGWRKDGDWKILTANWQE